MENSALLKLDVVERFIWFIKERESIRERKEVLHQKKPWTLNPILRDYRFCNVRRMDDKVSRYLKSNWYNAVNENLPPLTQALLARHLNKIETMRKLSPARQWDPDYLKKTLRGIDKPFGAAYVISGALGQTGKYRDKVAIIIDGVIGPIHNNPPDLDYSSVEKSVTELSKCLGLGSFMAGQVIGDLVHHPCFSDLTFFTDRWIWAAKGPGSSRGLCRLLGMPPKKTGFSQREFSDHLATVSGIIQEELPAIHRKLEAIDMQNCLCEFDKMERALHGEGRPKRKYNGKPGK